MEQQQNQAIQNNITIDVAKEEKAALEKILEDLGYTYNSTVNGGKTTMTLSLTDEEYDALSGAVLRYKLKSSVVHYANAGANALIGGTEYLAKDVAVPIAKLGMKVGAGAVRVGVESAVIAGSSAVNVVSEQGKATVEAIKSSAEFTEAKENISRGFGKLKSMFGLGGSRIVINKG